MKNSLDPKKMAEAVISAHQSSATQILIAAEQFARAWEAYSTNEWSDKQLETFLDLLFKGGVGADPNNSILRHRDAKDKERYTLSGAATFSYLKSVGEHPLFKNKEIRAACRVSGLTVLYNLVLLHQEIAGWAADPSGNFLIRDKAKEPLANKMVLNLLSKGSELTVREVKEEREKYIYKKRTNASHAPKQKGENKGRTGGVKSFSEVKGGKYDNVIVSPTENFLVEIAGKSLSSLRDDYDFDRLLSEKGDLSISVVGEHIEAAIKLGKVLEKNSLNLFVLKTSEQSNAHNIIDLSKEIVIATTKKKLNSRVSKAKGDDRVRLAVGSETEKNLHLFSSSSDENWDVVEAIDD